MARSHARVVLDIWSDGDWTDLPMPAQWLYLALISQTDINHAGVLSLTAKRWSHLCTGTSVKVIQTAMGVLAGRRYVVIDSETEELLVRTFIRNDEVWRQPNTLKNACASARAVQSLEIRSALRDELLKLDMGRIEKLGAPAGHESAADAVHRTIKVLDHVRGLHPTTPSEGYGDANGDTPGVGKAVGAARAGEGAGVGVRTSPPVEKNSSSVGPRSKLRGTRIPEDFAVTGEMVTWAREHHPRVDGRAETAKFIDHWCAKSGALGVKLDWEATWRNWIRKADEIAESRPGGRSRPARSPDPLPADPDAAFEDLRRRAAAAEAARIAGLSSPVIEPKPPSDPTDPREWDRAHRIEWIDLHKCEIRGALSRRVR